jgi:lipoprotein NlpI
MCKKTLFNILGLVVQKSDNFTHWIEKFSNVVKIDKKFADLDLAITIKKV